MIPIPFRRIRVIHEAFWIHRMARRVIEPIIYLYRVRSRRSRVEMLKIQPPIFYYRHICLTRSPFAGAPRIMAIFIGHAVVL